MLPHSILLQHIILIIIVTSDLIVSWTAFVDIDIILVAPTVVIVRLGINDPDIPTPGDQNIVPLTHSSLFLIHPTFPELRTLTCSPLS
jgi:hypothetical protein